MSERSGILDNGSFFFGIFLFAFTTRTLGLEGEGRHRAESNERESQKDCFHVDEANGYFCFVKYRSLFFSGPNETALMRGNFNKIPDSNKNVRFGGRPKGQMTDFFPENQPRVAALFFPGVSRKVGR